MRKVTARVLPVPAPARISTGPSVVSTASRCSAFSSSRRASICPRWLEKVCTSHGSRRWRCAQTCAIRLPFSKDSVFGGPAQVNFEIHKAAILFDGHYFGYVQMSGIDEFELASQVEKRRSPGTVLCGATTLACTPASRMDCSTSVHFLSRPVFGPPKGMGSLLPVTFLVEGRVITSACPFRRKRVQRLTISSESVRFNRIRSR